MKLCWDLETNGVDPDIVWMMFAIDLDTGEEYEFSDYNPDAPSMAEGLKMLNKATLHVGHNIIAFDMYVMNKLYGWELPEQAKVHDTLIMSRLNSYKRTHSHGLAGWGDKLGNDKIDFDSKKFALGDDPEVYAEMAEYCLQDVRLNVQVYKQLMAEVKKICEKKPQYTKALQLEMDFAKLDLQIRSKGWLFDMVKAEKYLAAMEAEMQACADLVEPNLPELKIWKDKEPKALKFNKNGNYHITTARALTEYLGYDVYPMDALRDNPPMNPDDTYQRFEMVQANLGNLDSVREYLFTIGWEPDDWNWKRVDKFNFEKTTPKLTTTSLEPLGEIGKAIGTFYSTRNRHAVLRGWIEAVRGGRLRGQMTTIGTPTFRVRHSTLVNIPSVDSPWGKEMRSLLIAEDGYKVVGADSAGNQMRGLCHYVGDDEFTNEVINGDVHQRNADVLGCKRSTAKGFLYAFLFGAGDAKLGEVLTGVKNKSVGVEAREKFANSIPGLAALRLKLEKAFNMTKAHGDPWFPGLDGRRIYVEQAHQALNYLLQGAEGVTCKAAFVWADRKLKEEGIDCYPSLFYHDEIAYVVWGDQAVRAKEIMIEAFREGPKAYGVTCMDGDGAIGDNYADVH